MAEVEKLRPEQVRDKEAPLMVCAYEDESKCRKIRIEGSISLNELRARLPDVPKDERIVFY